MDPMTMKVISTGLTMFGAYQQYEAGQEAEELREDQMKEDLRRAQAADRAKLATARAHAAASGIQMSGSPSMYIEELGAEQERQRNWLRKAGKAEAKAYGDQGTTSAIKTFASGLGPWT